MMMIMVATMMHDGGMMRIDLNITRNYIYSILAYLLNRCFFAFPVGLLMVSAFEATVMPWLST